ncbi:PREDICTED: uncharacterized protein LOC109590426, partial [Amphimedon queenslandica]|uniref:Uncharacterized protein n=1 Tax=Amphimedon queenslandica TaxID=400682 RepID=A0AAN0JYA9_AMPQE
MDQLIEYPTEREMKLQRYIQSLHEDLQVAHESKVSLQEALVETNKQVEGDDSNDIMRSVLEEMRQEHEKLIEEKQIITEDNEKLKLKAAEYHKEEVLEEKTQIEEKQQIITEDYEKLKLKLHCVDLTGRPGLIRHLKFAIAPVSTPSLPYQFSLVEGGEFKADSWYGSIQRKEFCL